MTSDPPAGQQPGVSAPGVCKRPGCGNILPAGDRGRTHQFCGDACARRFHNVLPGAEDSDEGGAGLADVGVR